jgi:murein DD-endopeptidase MepM/ murein hydrolase activator NlpD
MIRFKTAAAATALCAILAACADGPKPQYPIRLDPVAPPAPPPKPGAALEPRDPGRALVFTAAHGRAKRAPAASQDNTITVGAGDTLAAVSRKTSVPMEDLAKANGLKPPYRLTVGQTLKLPAKAVAEAQAAASDRNNEDEEVTVGRRETLAAIARRTGVSLQTLARINDLKPPYRLSRGQTLRLHERAPASSTAAKAVAKPPGREDRAATGEAASTAAVSTVTVKRRDTIRTLARRAGVSVADLARLNHLKPPYRLKPGQSILLPDQPQDASSRTPETAAAEPAARPEARSVTAGRRDTLSSIADRTGVSVETLARLNHLRRPYRLHRGQTIRLPAPAAAASYRVQEGDTLYSLARRFGTDPQTLARLNGIGPDATLQTGRRLSLPAEAKDEAKDDARDRARDHAPPARPTVIASLRPPPVQAAKPPLTGPATEPGQPIPYASLPSNPPVAAAPGLAPPTPPQVTAPPPSPPAPPVQTGAPPSDADVAAAGRGLFQWPARGTTLAGFGPLSGGQRNDGLDIAADPGLPVRAAAAGEVVYAGDSVPGFGNLVLVRHDGGWVTAYAHLAGIDVKMRQMVTQGQQIGAVGQTGGVTQPQLHFEIRYAPTPRDKARPIDPMLVLPK